MDDKISKSKKGKDSKLDKAKKNEKKKINNSKSNQSTGDDMFVEMKNQAWNYSVVIILVLMVLLCIYFQYRYEKSQRFSVSEDEEENFYDILGVDYNADLATIRKKYKELTKIWHPDKNPGCKPCHDKFLLISKAHEVLTDEAKRGEFDTKGGKNIFSSQPVILNVKNYHHLVEESNDFWVIIVYENTRGNRNNKFFADVWDEVSSKYKNIIKFGVIDVLQNENLLHFLPFKFQYYPNIITYLNGESSELFQDIESYSVKTLIQFIEESFVSKVNMIDDSSLRAIVSTENQTTEISNRVIKYEDLDINIVILSAKNYVDIVTKDFAKNYHDSLKIYQTEMGYFDKSKDILRTKGDHRVFIIYKDIVIENSGSDTSTVLKTKFKPLPITFKVTSQVSQKLQLSFNLVKSLTLQKIYKNNYVKHCTNKVILDGEEVAETVETETKINLCVIILDHKLDLDSNEINTSFYQILIENFEKNYNRILNPKKKKTQSEEYEIKVNFGKTNLDKNRELKNLYESYIKEKNIQTPTEKSKLFFIINDSQEKFTFRWFKDQNQIKEYFQELDNSDFFEDISFSFDFFANYNIREIREVFNEEKIFSFEKIITKSFYTQMQAAYIFSFIVIFLANNFYFKIEYLTLICIGISILISFMWQIINSLEI